MALNPVTAGARLLASTQVSVGSSPVLVVPGRGTRRSVLLVNIGGSSQIYFGNSTVSTASGSYLPAIDGASISIPTTADVWAVIASGSQNMSVLEAYD
jgi:hypothetical protein